MRLVRLWPGHWVNNRYLLPATVGPSIKDSVLYTWKAIQTWRNCVKFLWQIFYSDATIRKNLIAKFCIIDVDFPFWVQFCIIMQNWGNILKNFALLKLLKLKVGNLSNFLQYLAHLFHKLCLIYVIFFSLTINWHNSWGWDKSFHSITALCKQRLYWYLDI